MKIPNPWPYHPLTRYTCRGPQGETVVVTSTREREIEVPECDEVVMEPVKATGRGGKVSVIGQARIWSRDFGLLDIEDHVKKRQIEIEEAELKAKQRRDRERSKPAPQEKPVQIEQSLDIGGKMELGGTLEL